MIKTAKTLGYGTEVMLYNGTTKPVQEINPNDQLMAPDGIPICINSITTIKTKLFNIIQNSGIDYQVSKHHELLLKYTATRGIRTRKDRGGRVYSRHCYGAEKGDLKIISIEEYFKISNSHRHLLKAFKFEAISFPKHVKVDLPYFIGLWLGDGDKNSPTITTAYLEIVDYLKNLAKSLMMKISVYVDGRGNKAKRYRLQYKKGHTNYLMNLLNRFNLRNNTGEHHVLHCSGRDNVVVRNGIKHIPEVYKKSSKEDRMELLAGIIDSDGHLGNGLNTFEITQKSEVLANDISFLALSLGFRVKKTIKTIKGSDYHKLSIIGDTDQIPTKVERKKTTQREQNKDYNVWGFKVEEGQEGLAYGFEISKYKVTGDQKRHINIMLSDFTAIAMRIDS